MRAILYDSNEEYVGMLTGFISLEIDEEINVYNALSAELANTPKHKNLLDRSMYMGVYDKNTNNYQLFMLERPTYADDTLQISGIESAADDLDVQGLIIDKRYQDKSLGQVLPDIFEGSTWTYVLRFSDEANTQHDTNFYRISRKQALDKILKLWNVERHFRCEIDGNKIVSKVCYFFDKLGHSTNKRLVQGKNVTSFKYIDDRQQLYTAAVGRGAGLAIQDDDGNNTGGYSRSIEFDSIEWSTANGDPVNKPLGQLYVEIPDATANWGWVDSDGTKQPRITVLEFNEEKDVNQLLLETYQKLLELSHPQIQITAQVVDTGQLELGDTVTVVAYEPQRFAYRTRVTEIKRDMLDDTNTEVIIGASSIITQAEREKNTDDNQQAANDDTDGKLDGLNQYTLQQIHEVKIDINKTIDDNDKLYQEQFKTVNDDIAETKRIAESEGAGAIIMHRNKDNKENIDYMTAQNNDGSMMRFSGNGLEFVGANGSSYAAITQQGRIAAYLLDASTINALNITSANITTATLNAINMTGSLTSYTQGGSMEVHIGNTPSEAIIFPDNGGEAMWVSSDNYQSLVSSGKLMVVNKQTMAANNGMLGATWLTPTHGYINNYEIVTADNYPSIVGGRYTTDGEVRAIIKDMVKSSALS